MSNPTSSTNPISLLSRRPIKPSLKITPLITPHIALPPSDLTALVTASIKAQPSPRRNLPEFKMQGTDPNPEAPPSTPVEDGFLYVGRFSSAESGGDSAGTPTSQKRVRFDFGEMGPSPRSSEESVRSDASVEVER